MDEDSPGRPQDDDEFDVRGGPRNVSKLEKMKSERTERTKTRSVTTNAVDAQHLNSSDSMSSDRVISRADGEGRWAAAAVPAEAERRSRRTQRRSDILDERSDAQKRLSRSEERQSGTRGQTDSSRSLSRRDRNVAAAEMAYQTVGLPADVEPTRVAKRSTRTASASGRSKHRGGLSGVEHAADLIVEDTMEKAIEAMYGKVRRQPAAAVRDSKISSSAETTSVDRHHARTTANGASTRQGSYGYESRPQGQTVREETSRDESRRKAISYVRLEHDDDDLQRPASADGRVTNGVDYAARRRGQAMAARGHQRSRPRHQAAYISPSAARYQRRTATNQLASQRASGYSSDIGLMQSPAPQHRPRLDSSADFSTTVEIRNPRTRQIAAAQEVYSSDESQASDTKTKYARRVPTLTKGMVTKFLHGAHTQSTPPMQRTVNEACRFDVQSPTSPIQFSASPPPGFDVLSRPEVHRRGQPSAVIPVGEDRPTFRTSAVDDNFLLKRAPPYDRRVDLDAATDWTRPIPLYSGSAGHRTPITPTEKEERRRTSSYTAFSNEPIIVSNVDDDEEDFTQDQTTSMRRARSMVTLHEVSRPSTTTGRSQTPICPSRPDISMTNRQVLNLYLFNRRPSKDGETELETLTRRINFDEEQGTRTGTKQTQTTNRGTSPPPVHRKTTYHVTGQRPAPTKPQRCSREIQTDSAKTTPRRRKQTPSRVTEEMIIVKPNIVETREAEMVGDVFADRRRTTPIEPKSPIVPTTTRSMLGHSQTEKFEEPEPEEEILETTVVEEKEQRIEMMIREDLEFSLQRSRGTTKVADGSADDSSRIEPWWIPDKFEAFVERKRQKITQTKDIDNKDDHVMRIDVDSATRSQDANVDSAASIEAENPNNESVLDCRSTGRNASDTDRDVRVPMFLNSRYRSPGVASPSSSLVRAKMTTHSEPKNLNRRHHRPHYLTEREKYYGSLFRDSQTSQDVGRSSLVTISPANKHQHQPASSVDVPELRPTAADDDDDEASDGFDSEPQEPQGSSNRRYLSICSHYISPPLSSAESAASISVDDDVASRFVPDNRLPTRSKQYTIINQQHVDQVPVDRQTCGPDRQRVPDSLHHFDRVLTEIEEELPPPPPSLLQEPSGRRSQVITSESVLPSQRRFNSSVIIPSSGSAPATKKKPKPPAPPEKSWKRGIPQPMKSHRLYSSEDRLEKVTSGGYPQNQRTSDKERSGTPTAATTGSDFHRELGDRNYISLSLTEPVQSSEQSRRVEARRKDRQIEPGGFSYGWTASSDQQSKKPGRYLFRHSRPSAKDFDTESTPL